ncbi:rhodanese-like domain-containing protein [Solirubrobacter sp. CPCC 204708]|uniref:Rhodanese-like domain-containing protein n=1 Tax=Solirubrobacter deserti TaxID=2282478 RepID=A0ABT4RP23_9ACTN|nr:rhodanese-like domain-containing protein [Solirubrobacter deserti]MBE2317501.1 rhodanese-like domain-containing protein [Solirubrobacter deserti]MDA0140322.1 rhodanese-like domain-containing protein [Solirubrobacter deserti]
MSTIAQRASRVSQIAPAPPEIAHRHFVDRLSVETDCADVAADLAEEIADYTVVDVRGRASYERAHVPGALNAPSGEIDATVAAALPEGLLVVYCWGPGCNGAHKAARALTAEGRQVKEMIGGMEYWIREGQPIAGTQAEALIDRADHALVG